MKRFLVAALVAGTATFGVVLTNISSAPAAITTQCTNGGGNTPQGNCNGGGLTQTNVNPAGQAPPGQNK